MQAATFISWGSAVENVRLQPDWEKIGEGQWTPGGFIKLRCGMGSETTPYME